MPASRRAVRARLRVSRKALSRRASIDAALNELAACQFALSAAASGIAAGFATSMIDGDGAFELLMCVYNRQAAALHQLDVATGGKGGAA